MADTRWMAAALLLAGCARSRGFDTQLASYRLQSTAAAARAHHCADELRSLTETGGALAASSTVLPMRSTSVATRGEIAQAEKSLDGALETIRRGAIDGPAALERVVSAATRVHQIQAALCEARDVAFTLANTVIRRGVAPHGARDEGRGPGAD